MATLSAVEFFSGIGGFAEACRTFTPHDSISAINIICSFDQSTEANDVYFANFGHKPNSHNLDSISEKNIPQADLWWLSPPCTPYSRRGKGKDIDDARAASLLNIINLLDKFLPQYLLLENVLGFSKSQAQAKLSSKLRQLGYAFRELSLCQTMFGIPMKRPRYFLIASRDSKDIAVADAEDGYKRQLLSSFLDANSDPQLTLDQKTITRFGNSLNIIDAQLPDSYTICFTSNYWKCMKASGSFLKKSEGVIRRFSDREILNLLGFSKEFAFPQNIPLKTRWRFLGNSLDVRSVTFVLKMLLNETTYLKPPYSTSLHLDALCQSHR